MGKPHFQNTENPNFEIRHNGAFVPTHAWETQNGQIGRFEIARGGSPHFKNILPGIMPL
ncbi:MAG TPA: hypothetical protein VK742_20365 [Candidatus Sulfotelmatobacter sp.]|nr:hypothetical protein [Candidatus Sulfotelmatobacter sp.]